MISVSDISKLLEHVPIWKALKGLPARVEALEKQVEELQAKLDARPAVMGDRCPSCGEHAFMRENSRPMTGELGELGGTVEEWRCKSCGRGESKTHLPG